MVLPLLYGPPHAGRRPAADQAMESDPPSRAAGAETLLLFKLLQIKKAPIAVIGMILAVKFLNVFFMISYFKVCNINKSKDWTKFFKAGTLKINFSNWF